MLAVILWFLLGTVGLVVGLAITAADLFGAPPRWLLAAAATLLALVPIAILIDGLPTPSTITTSFARDHWVADSLAKAGVALMVVGVFREVLSSSGGAVSATRSDVPGPDVDQA
ncbi:hypothetical protein [Pseudofrankia asymbiotica]|uniref:Uncharacterized protein n=1 Tax=Pseudofrankia asymbiotica TaxID=1834516 RepID=A0A1V2ILQ7_9ACTN|nr:hypothetical protein [Pseudofrankia asymbiotica]ONH33920.1 hypothetical protein BL253_00015 [Pseudofrankia asymbiotica]